MPGGGGSTPARASRGFVERFVLDGQHARLTQAALETLAVVAYRQPVSRTRVSAVRGVNVDGVMRTLVSRGLVEEAGADHDSGALLYRTSPYFLERLGLRTLDDLPPLANYLPEATSIDQLKTNSQVKVEMPEAENDREGVRLQKVLAAAGVGSRRACEELIEAGRVEVDGRQVTEQGLRIDPEHAVVKVDGARVSVRASSRLPRGEQAAGDGEHDVGPAGATLAGRSGH